MKKIFTSFLIAVSLMFIAGPGLAIAQTDVLKGPCDLEPNALACQGRGEQKPECNSVYGQCGVITKATQLMAILVGVAAVIVIIIGGFLYVLSSGDPSRVNSAKSMILYAIIGLVVAVLAQSIVVYILKKL
ncbi:hypothetical protein H0X10_02855 [Candidatus Saccharibacteria bacterium]|nr:hypothetical protein [Candidatus Saccharibacteria bacterium]